MLKRVEVIEHNFPDFFDGNLLDIGCNKGFFELYHRGPVTAIDSVKEYVDLCCDLKPDGDFQHCSFGGFKTEKQFDRIFIGNGPHHLFIEAGGWSWVEKLARLSKGQVLLEGPTGMESRDARNCIPPELVNEFNKERFLTAFDPWFSLVKQVRSPLVDRFFTLFIKKDELIHAPMSRYADYLKFIYGLAAPHIKPTDTVMEICTRHDRGVLGKQLLPHSEYIMVDRNPGRPGLNLDVVNDELPECDVTISTAILHHTAPIDLHRLLANITKRTKRTLLLSGPNAKMLPDLFGDHRYHIVHGEISAIIQSLGWKTVETRPCGLSEPFVELFMVYQR